MKEKPSLETKKNIRVVYVFDIPSGDFYDTFDIKEDAMTALMEEYKPCYTYHSFDYYNKILCYETEQQCLEAYDAFHRLIPSATYIGRGEIYESQC